MVGGFRVFLGPVLYRCFYREDGFGDWMDGCWKVVREIGS